MSTPAPLNNQSLVWKGFFISSVAGLGISLILGWLINGLWLALLCGNLLFIASNLVGILNSFRHSGSRSAHRVATSILKGSFVKTIVFATLVLLFFKLGAVGKDLSTVLAMFGIFVTSQLGFSIYTSR